MNCECELWKYKSTISEKSLTRYNLFPGAVMHQKSQKDAQNSCTRISNSFSPNFVKNELNRGHSSVHLWLAIYLKLFNWRKALSFQRFSLTKSGFYQIILYPLKFLERIKVFLKGFLQYKLKGIFYFKLLFTA